MTRSSAGPVTRAKPDVAPPRPANFAPAITSPNTVAPAITAPAITNIPSVDSAWSSVGHTARVSADLEKDQETGILSCCRQKDRNIVVLPPERQEY